MLESCTLQKLTYLVMGLSALRSVGLWEVLGYGRRRSHVLTRTGEDWDRRDVCHDAAVDLPRPGTGPSPALATRELLFEHLVLALELPLGFGNFELPSANLLRCGVLPELLWMAFRHIPRAGGCGRVVTTARRMDVALRGVSHEALLRGVVTP